MDKIIVRQLRPEDYGQFRNIVRETEPLFGSQIGDSGFYDMVMDLCKKKNTFCTVNEHDNLTGAIIINRETHWIEWLAVKKRYQGKEYGRELLEKAIKELKGNDIFVRTFSEGIPEGIPARKLYDSFRFKHFVSAEKNPAGYDTEVLKRGREAL